MGVIRTPAFTGLQILLFGLHCFGLFRVALVYVVVGPLPVAENYRRKPSSSPLPALWLGGIAHAAHSRDQGGGRGG